MGDLLFAGALVTMMQGGKPVGTATGFFYVKSDVLYFVTNRQSLSMTRTGSSQTFCAFGFTLDANDLTKNVDRDVPLYISGNPRWHVHPKYPNPAIDVAVVQLEQKSFTAGLFIKAVGSSHFFPEKFIMNPGEDIMVIGFPRGLSDTAHNLPLVRNALVSSAYGVDFDGTPTFLVDANQTDHRSRS